MDAGVQYKMPTSSYVCAELTEKEWQTFFQNHPQLIGLSGDLPGPGHYFSTDDLAIPVLATRDKDGRFHAFVNACRHRGARVVPEGRGQSQRFVCPYHGWGYSGSGELLVIAQNDHFGTIDKSCHGLIELPSVERHGFLWIHPQPGGTLDIDALLGPVGDELASGDFGQLIYCGGSHIDMKLNWKLANDTFGETYHFQKLHKQTLGQSFYGDNMTCEAIGQHLRTVTARKVIDQLWDLPEQQWQLCQGALLIYYLFPNIQITVGPGRATLVRIYPDPKNPGRSFTRLSHYFTRQAIDLMATAKEDGDKTAVVSEQQAFGQHKNLDVTFSLEAIMKIFNDVLKNEDYVIGEQQQQTAANGLMQYSIFGRNEAPLHHYHNTFRQALGLPPLERL